MTWLGKFGVATPSNSDKIEKYLNWCQVQWGENESLTESFEVMTQGSSPLWENGP